MSFLCLKTITSFTPLPWALGRPAPALGAPGARPWGASTPPHASVRQWGALPGKLTRALESRRPKPIPSPALFSPAAADPRGGPDQQHVPPRFSFSSPMIPFPASLSPRPDSSALQPACHTSARSCSNSAQLTRPLRRDPRANPAEPHSQIKLGDPRACCQGQRRAPVAPRPPDRQLLLQPCAP